LGETLAIALGVTLSNTLYITDQITMLDLMTRNIARNHLNNVHASILDWGTPVDPSLPKYPDILLAADCVYFEPAFPLLLQTMEGLIGEQTKCYFCFKRRRRADLGFVKMARKKFEVRDVEDDPEKAVWEREQLFMYLITKKKRSKAR